MIPGCRSRIEQDSSTLEQVADPAVAESVQKSPEAPASSQGEPAAKAAAEPAQDLATKAPASPSPARANARVTAVEADEAGRFFVTGQAEPGAQIRIYLNDTPLAMVRAAADGAFGMTIEKGMTPGDYRIRIDDIEAISGKVLTRAEVPFTMVGGKKLPAQVAAAPEPAPATPAPTAVPPAPRVAAAPEPARATPAPTAAPPAPQVAAAPGRAKKPAVLAFRDLGSSQAPPSSPSPASPPAPTSSPVQSSASTPVQPASPASSAEPPSAPAETAGPTPHSSVGQPAPAQPRPADSGGIAAAAPTPDDQERPVQPLVAAPMPQPPPAPAVAANPPDPDPAPGASDVAAQTASPSVAVIPEIKTVTVVRGDNLWRISRKTYGRGTRYTVIYGANSEQIRNPHLIYPGQIFVTPEDKG